MANIDYTEQDRKSYEALMSYAPGMLTPVRCANLSREFLWVNCKGVRYYECPTCRQSCHGFNDKYFCPKRREPSAQMELDFDI